MKKLLSVVMLNILFFILLFFIVEIFAYKSIFTSDVFSFPDYKKFEKLKDEFLVGNHLYVNYKKPKEGEPIYYIKDGREINGENYTKGAVLTLGDSYTYGLGLKKEETFANQLAEFTKRPVYNWAFCTEGTDYSVLEFKNQKNIENLKRQTEKIPLKYVIFTYTYPQFSRAFSPNRQYRYFNLRKYSLLGDQKFSQADYLYSVLALKNKLFVHSLYQKGIENSVILLIKGYIKSINNDIKTNFPDAKLIFLIYSDDMEIIKKSGLNASEEAVNSLDINKWKDLENDGIIVVSTRDLTGKKAGIDDLLENERTITIHPNAKAWGKVVPLLSKKLGL